MFIAYEQKRDAKWEYCVKRNDIHVFRKKDRTGNHDKQNKPDSENLHVLIHIRNMDLIVYMFWSQCNKLIR